MLPGAMETGASEDEEVGLRAGDKNRSVKEVLSVMRRNGGVVGRTTKVVTCQTECATHDSKEYLATGCISRSSEPRSK